MTEEEFWERFVDGIIYVIGGAAFVLLVGSLLVAGILEANEAVGW